MGGNRPQLLAVFESAMDANSSLRKQTVDGQISLFDMAFGGAPLVQENHALPNLPDYPLRQRLALEKEIAGVYITGHPLDDYRDVLGKLPFSTADLDGLEEREDHGLSLDGQIVDMGGILTEVKGKATKKGAYMGFITLEDLTGQIECLVFPKVYERYQGMMAVDDLVVLHGRLSIREEEAPKLLVEKLIPLEAWASGGIRPRRADGAEHRAPRAAAEAPHIRSAEADRRAGSGESPPEAVPAPEPPADGRGIISFVAVSGFCAGVSAPAGGEDDAPCAENRLVRRKRRVFESAERAAGCGKCEIVGKQVIA